jgi:magnesium-transporting ATPase (P-type)
VTDERPDVPTVFDRLVGAGLSPERIQQHLTAEQGMRVLAVGAQDFTAEAVQAAGDPKDLLDRIVLVALVGIVDPPRPEARKAIRNAATRASVSG